MSVVRSKMFVDKLIKKKLEERLWIFINKLDKGDLPYQVKERIVKYSLMLMKFIVGVGVGLFMIYFFNNMIYNRFGFEKTVITILVVMLITYWNKE